MCVFTASQVGQVRASLFQERVMEAKGSRTKGAFKKKNKNSHSGASLVRQHAFHVVKVVERVLGRVDGGKAGEPKELLRQ